MNRSQEEAEVIIRLDYLTQQANVCVSRWPAMARKLEKLYGPSLDGQSEQSRRWVIPMRLVSLRRSKTTGLALSGKKGKPFPTKAIPQGVVEQGMPIKWPPRTVLA
jgi:hypothetical protein